MTQRTFQWALLLSGMMMVMHSPAFSQSANAADKILGEWINETHDRKIEFYRAAGTYEARLSWLKNADGKARTGQVVIRGLTYNEGRYEKGRLYMPARDAWYNCSAVLKDEHTLAITGSAGLFSKTKTWTR
ncbi:DUF2147 domain-containing protein [Chitinophaga japonensis]|uniref:Uncharacterized protein DUF2147 n=1 Tax=Chitinophaga japonensis TaxID=104662 RepID=A0A562TF26_CHIJA|nr:DUF2147 domain-containing protein [Chitinophaga japonensis]TWI92141.1 uncharacterized protein DUF2147 [Chitinophaga japonensis]